MILKERLESEDLMTLRYLHTRMTLTEQDKQHYMNLEKGYEGEMKFDEAAKCLRRKTHPQ